MLEKIKELDTPETIDKAIDIMFEWIDDLCWGGDWDKINETLDSIDVEEWSVGTLVGFLSIARPAGPHLIGGESFYNRVVAKFLRDEGEKRTKGLTGGLEFRKFDINGCNYSACPTCKEK